jgi:hypothetical protein
MQALTTWLGISPPPLSGFPNSILAAYWGKMWFSER